MRSASVQAIVQSRRPISESKGPDSGSADQELRAFRKIISLHEDLASSTGKQGGECYHLE